MFALFLALATTPSRSGGVPELTSGRLAILASAPYDKGEKSGKHEILGTLHGVQVVADYPCGDICPTYTTRIIHYNLEVGPLCEAKNGIAEFRSFNSGIAPVSRLYCIPAVLKSERPSPSQVCGISGVSRTAAGVSITFDDERWFNIKHLGKSQGYLVGPMKPTDPFATGARSRLNANVGDTGWTTYVAGDECRIEVVQNGGNSGVYLRYIYDPPGSNMKPLETEEFLPAEQSSASE